MKTLVTIALLLVFACAADAAFTSKQVRLIRKIQENVKQLKIELRESNDANEVTKAQLRISVQQAQEIQSKIDRKNAQIASLSKKLGHYETAWSIVAVVAAALVALMIFKLVGFAIPWGMLAIGAGAVATYLFVFYLPNWL